MSFDSVIIPQISGFVNRVNEKILKYTYDHDCRFGQTRVGAVIVHNGDGIFANLGSAAKFHGNAERIGNGVAKNDSLDGYIAFTVLSPLCKI